MKVTNQELRQIINEELEMVLNENILNSIAGFFVKKPDIGGFVVDPNQRTYPQGSYGHFAQTNAILIAMHEEGVEINKETISKVLQAIASAGATVGADPDAGKLKKAAVGIIGLGAIFAGVYAAGAAAIALTIAGISGFAFQLVNLFEKDPSKAERHPFLDKWKLDEKWREILDDDLETDVEEKYRDHFMNKIKSNPDEPILSINLFLRRYLANNHAGRNITRPSSN